MQTPKGEINDKIMELTKDEELLQKMGTAASPEECYNMVKDRIEGVSFEEFTASMSVAAAYVKESQSSELNEADLDMVAGGKSTDERNSELKSAANNALIGVGSVAGAIIVTSASAAAF